MKLKIITFIILLIFIFIFTYHIEQPYLGNYNFNLPKNEVNENIKNKETNNQLSIISFGDIMLGRAVGGAIDQGLDPFAQIKKILKTEKNFQNPEYVLGNLEGPIAEGASCQKKEIVFNFKENVIQILKNSGINVLSLANNHSYDCYSFGLKKTKENLDKIAIDYFGGEFSAEKNFLIKESKAKKIAFIGIDTTLGNQKIEPYYSLVNELKKNNDYVIAVIHWGEEYVKTPEMKQATIGRELIESGADVVFGHHPHVVKPIEIYMNKPIFYSLGNMVFDQIGKEVNTGIGARVNFLNNNKMTIQILPFEIVNYSPQFMDDIDSQKYCTDLEVLSTQKAKTNSCLIEL